MVAVAAGVLDWIEDVMGAAAGSGLEAGTAVVVRSRLLPGTVGLAIALTGVRAMGDS
jgi:hypothetical protein